jgi:CAAX protease family protein
MSAGSRVTAADRRSSRPRPRPDVGALVAFFAVAYALSWAWAVPLALTHQVVNRGAGWPTHYPALLGPAIAAVAVTAWSAGRPGVRDLLRRLVRWRVPLRWWLAALSPIGLLAVALVVQVAMGNQLPAVADFGRFSGTPAIGLVGVFLVVTLVGAVGEEVGWRGYALPQLQLRYRALTASLILAPLWFLWHLPQFFVIATYRQFGPVDYVGMLFGLTCGAVVLTWLYNRSGGSILLVAVWHGTYNMVSGTQAATGMLAAVVSTLVMIQALVLILLDVRAHRRDGPLDPACPPGTA